MNIHSYIAGVIMVKREDRIKRITKQRQEQILKASLYIFSRRGFDAATIPDIAREAGGLFTTLGCDVEAVVLAGLDRELASALRRSLGRLAPVFVYEGLGERTHSRR